MHKLLLAQFCSLQGARQCGAPLTARRTKDGVPMNNHLAFNGGEELQLINVGTGNTQWSIGVCAPTPMPKELTSEVGVHLGQGPELPPFELARSSKRERDSFFLPPG